MGPDAFARLAERAARADAALSAGAAALAADAVIARGQAGVRLDGHGGAREEAARIGVPFLGEIPLDKEVRLRSDSGEPIVATQPDALHTALYRDVARQVWATLEAGNLARPAPRIVVDG